jgi:hypothetical protein
MGSAQLGVAATRHYPTMEDKAQAAVNAELAELAASIIRRQP